jgi:sporulation protein YlmC with PRC-barrel domain
MVKMEPFVYEEYARTEIPSHLGYPYILPITSVNEEVEFDAPVKYHAFAPDEFAVCPGLRIEAIDGSVGEVDVLRIDSASMQITHLILRERHVFEQKEIVIPVSQIEHIGIDVIYLSAGNDSSR